MANPRQINSRQMAALVEMAEAWGLDNAEALRAAEVVSSQRNIDVTLEPLAAERLGHALILIRAMEV
ncbi:hypothetical protein [Sagittula sp. S175]|uniref:hypothetical protein n=1 Tax=Sagittula sp. S175 TaxID=3415129 RepID=UPI003C7A8B78